MYLAIHPLRRLIAEGESEVLDFKKTITSLPKIAKTLVAFANSKGGRLLIGVNDGGEITGIQSEEEQFMIEQAAALYCKPRVPLRCMEHVVNGKAVLEVIVPPATAKPYYARDEEGKLWVYVRVEDKSVLATPILVEVMRRQAREAHNLIELRDDYESRLLDFLNNRTEGATHNQVCKLLNISRKKAAKILAGLVTAGVVRHHFDHSQEWFSAA